MATTPTETHTPGPWVVNTTGWKPWDGAIEICAGETIAWTPSGVGNEADNARLIAAAPEMLEALKAAAAEIGDWARPTGANGMVSAREDHPLVVAGRNAHLIIDAAEGRQS